MLKKDTVEIFQDGDVLYFVDWDQVRFPKTWSTHLKKEELPVEKEI